VRRGRTATAVRPLRRSDHCGDPSLAAFKAPSGTTDMEQVSDESTAPAAEAAADRSLLPWLLAALAGAHVLAAVAGLVPGGTSLPVLADALLGGVLLVGILVGRLMPPLVTWAVRPGVVDAIGVVAIGAAGVVSGLRAGSAGEPWLGADVVLAVLAAAALPSWLGFALAALAAQAGWGAMLAAAAWNGENGGLPLQRWVLLAALALPATLAAVAVRRGRVQLAGQVVSGRAAAAQQAVTDPLTGISNRRGLELVALPMIEHARRQGEAVHCLFIDLDEFRSVNDALGRAHGDEVLVAVCEAVMASVRATDVVSRWAGDQFVVLGPGTGTSPLEMERRVRTQLVGDPPVPTDVWNGRVSIGSATLVPWDEGNVDSLLRRAEEDMQLRRSLRRQSRARTGSTATFGEATWSDRRGDPPGPSSPHSPDADQVPKDRP
jgi:diguanylate cyclase (GGDEF)-like protein